MNSVRFSACFLCTHGQAFVCGILCIISRLSDCVESQQAIIWRAGTRVGSTLSTRMKSSTFLWQSTSSGQGIKMCRTNRFRLPCFRVRLRRTDPPEQIRPCVGGDIHRGEDDGGLRDGAGCGRAAVS